MQPSENNEMNELSEQNHTIPNAPDNVQIRLKARQSLTGKWFSAAFMPLISGILCPILLIALFFLFNWLAPDLMRQIAQMSENARNYGVSADLSASALLILISLIVGAFSAMIYMGYYSYYLNIAKGEKATVGTCFSFLAHHPLKAIGLMFAIWFKTCVWTLPGLGLLAVLLPAGNNGFAVFLGFLGMIATFALGAAALLRYALIPYYLADDPDISIREAIQKGKTATKDKKRQLFCMTFATVGWAYLAVSALQRLVPVLTGFPWAILLYLALLPLLAYHLVALGHFYLETEPNAQQAAEQA